MTEEGGNEHMSKSDDPGQMGIGASRESPGGLTLDGLARFLQQCRDVGISDDVKPAVRVTLGGKVKRIEVKTR